MSLIHIPPQQSAFWVCSMSLNGCFLITIFVLIAICSYSVHLLHPGGMCYWSIRVLSSVSFVGSLSASASSLKGSVCPMGFASVRQYLIFRRNTYFVYTCVYKTCLSSETLFFQKSPQQSSNMNRPLVCQRCVPFACWVFPLLESRPLRVSKSRLCTVCVVLRCSFQSQNEIKWGSA